MTAHTTTMRALALLSLLGLSVGSFAQQVEDPVVSLKLAKASVSANGTVNGVVTIKFAEGLHGYQNPPSDPYQIPIQVSFTGVKLLKATYPKGKPFTIPGDPKPSMVYEGTIEIPVQLKAGSKIGPQPITMKLNFQLCNESNCYPPSSLSIKSSLKVTKG